tara:strand:- start:35 stop:226 length:192 start_codon:yes stop_codon:yes gene_type:complete
MVIAPIGARVDKSLTHIMKQLQKLQQAYHPRVTNTEPRERSPDIVAFNMYSDIKQINTEGVNS